jgi:hypothetical protein
MDFTSELMYDEIKDNPIGGSEFQFYNLIFNIAKNKKIICYNKIKNECESNNIEYKNIDNLNYNIFYPTDIIIIQRLFPDINILKIFKKNQIYIWLHDYDFNSVCFQFQKNKNDKKKDEFLRYINDNNINFIFNSEFTKKYFNINFSLNNMIINDTRQNIIYNILYTDMINKKSNNTIIKEKTIVYASGWNKGIQKIIEIFEYILMKDSAFKLILMSPGYEYEKYKDYVVYLKDKFKDNIIIYGPVKKKIYYEIIQNCGCVLAPSFPETFGCVFSESYFVGTPVVCDIKSGAVKEIIGSENVVNYKNKDEVYNKIVTRIESNEKIELENKFLLDYNLNIWKKLLLLL